MAIAELIERVQSRRRLPEPRLRRLIRRSARLSLDDVAKALSVTRSAVSRWERGLREPRDDALGRYVDLLERLARER